MATFLPSRTPKIVVDRTIIFSFPSED